MKLFYSIIFLFAALLIFSCGEKEKEPLEVTVGMTYDEVEGILGKPESILRGANELYSDIDNLPEETLKTINTDTIDYKADNNRWFAPHQVKTSGNSLYVTWVYKKTKMEKFYVLFNKFKDDKKTATKKVPVYYLGDKQVSKEEYDTAIGSLYKEPGETGKEKLYDKTVQKTKVPIDSSKSKLIKQKYPQTKGKMIEKRIEYVTKSTVSSKEVIESVDRVNYEVEYKRCVIFDSSSERVTEHDYFPFTVKELDNRGK